MNIEIGNFYQSQTPQGVRTAKCTSMGTGYIHYGIYSLSNYANPGDGQSCSIESHYIADSTSEQVQLWEDWNNEQ